MPGFHHVELWVASIDEADGDWAWLLERIGFAPDAEWSTGRSWSAGGAYLTLTESPNLSTPEHDRRRPGLNHLAFTADDEVAVDALMADGPAHGWHPLYLDRYPHAGGPDHYAGWLENSAGFKVEVVAEPA